MDPQIQNVLETIDDLDDQHQKLVIACTEAKERAYCPYSNFRVGCAVLTKSGEIYKGCNVENASYSLVACAERVAIANAVVNGHRNFSAIAISSDIVAEFLAPCGACRQYMAEFGMDWSVILVKPDKTIHLTAMDQLLPLSFGAQHLSEKRE